MRSIRIWFTKKDTARYISHLDLTRCLIRAFRRTDIPLWYTEGFNPHPYLVFGMPLPLGVEGLREVLDIRLNDDNYPDERVLSELNRATVPGIEFLEVDAPKEKPLSIVMGKYTVMIPSIETPEEFSEKCKKAVADGNITIEKKTKKGGIKEINVCEHIRHFHSSYDKNSVILNFVLPAGNDFTVNPVSFCSKLFEIIGESEVTNHKIIRHRLMTKDEKEFK